MQGTLSGNSARTRRNKTAEAIGRAKDHIDENFSEPLKLVDLAVIAELSVFRFATMFRREIGLPPHRYLCHVRARHAQELLREGIPAAIVASEAGFVDQSHLSRHFKSIFGMTPGQYQSAVGKSSAKAHERTNLFRANGDKRAILKGGAVA